MFVYLVFKEVGLRVVLCQQHLIKLFEQLLHVANALLTNVPFLRLCIEAFLLPVELVFVLQVLFLRLFDHFGQSKKIAIVSCSETIVVFQAILYCFYIAFNVVAHPKKQVVQVYQHLTIAFILNIIMGTLDFGNRFTCSE